MVHTTSVVVMANTTGGILTQSSTNHGTAEILKSHIHTYVKVAVPQKFPVNDLFQKCLMSCIFSLLCLALVQIILHNQCRHTASIFFQQQHDSGKLFPNCSSADGNYRAAAVGCSLLTQNFVKATHQRQSSTSVTVFSGAGTRRGGCKIPTCFTGI